MNRKIAVLVVLVLISSASILPQTGVKRKRPLPYDYGRVVINNYCEKSGRTPVVFQHWVHRSMFTCRVCHVDIGFAMKGRSHGHQGHR